MTGGNCYFLFSYFRLAVSLDFSQILHFINCSPTQNVFRYRMTLTHEQKERIRVNREIALKIREDRLRMAGNITEVENKTEYCQPVQKDNCIKQELLKGHDDEEKERVELEDFEIGASQYVTKQEAMRMYCVPDGTLQVCDFVEKENPLQKKFAPMKLYDRTEIRIRSRKRFGSMEALITERRRRELKRLQKDLENNDDIFKRTKR